MHKLDLGKKYSRQLHIAGGLKKERKKERKGFSESLEEVNVIQLRKRNRVRKGKRMAGKRTLNF